LFTGVASGYLASWIGYGWFFDLTFVLSVPVMLLALVVMKTSIMEYGESRPVRAENTVHENQIAG